MPKGLYPPSEERPGGWASCRNRSTRAPDGATIAARKSLGSKVAPRWLTEKDQRGRRAQTSDQHRLPGSSARENSPYPPCLWSGSMANEGGDTFSNLTESSGPWRNVGDTTNLSIGTPIFRNMSIAFSVALSPIVALSGAAPLGIVACTTTVSSRQTAFVPASSIVDVLEIAPVGDTWIVLACSRLGLTSTAVCGK